MRTMYRDMETKVLIKGFCDTIILECFGEHKSIHIVENEITYNNFSSSELHDLEYYLDSFFPKKRAAFKNFSNYICENIRKELSL